MINVRSTNMTATVVIALCCSSWSWRDVVLTLAFDNLAENGVLVVEMIQRGLRLLCKV